MPKQANMSVFESEKQDNSFLFGLPLKYETEPDQLSEACQQASWLLKLKEEHSHQQENIQDPYFWSEAYNYGVKKEHFDEPSDKTSISPHQKQLFLKTQSGKHFEVEETSYLQKKQYQNSQNVNHCNRTYSNNLEKPCKFRKKKAMHSSLNEFAIDIKTLPFIFRFNYFALQRLTMSGETPALAYEIFRFLREKLIVRRYSEGGKYPNRMKYQEKVKFLMRAFDHKKQSYVYKKNQTFEHTKGSREKFNRQKQIEFFKRKDVHEQFLSQISQAIRKKRYENERRIKQLQSTIELALNHLTSPEKARKIFENGIKRKQLPWTDNMFKDIEEFSQQLYFKYTSPPKPEFEEDGYSEELSERESVFNESSIDVDSFLDFDEL